MKVDDTADSSLAIVSDIDQTAKPQIKTHRTRRSQSDLPPPPILDNEPTQRRRRLVTGKEHRSRNTVSTSSGQEDEDDEVEVKQEDRLHPALKRSRVSSTPDPPEDSKDRKKRRTVLESSPDEIRPRTSVTTIPTPPIPSIEEESVKGEIRGSQGSVDSTMAAPSTKPTEQIKVVLTQEPKELTPPDISVAAAVNEPDAEILPDAVDDESDDPYSPPPAVEPPMNDGITETEPVDQEAADRLVQEQASLKEAEEKAEQERKASEAAAEKAKLAQEAEEKRKQEEEIARRKHEEERQERLKQEVESRRRSEALARERERLNTLPILLARTAQMIDENDSDVRSPSWLSKFLPLYVVKTKQLDPNSESATDEEWIPNFQVAGLLSTKDLKLQAFGSLEHRPVSIYERQCLWRVARLNLSYDTDPNALWTTSVSKATEMEKVAQGKFMAMEELFWVKFSDFLNQIPQFPHLGQSIPRQPISLKSYTEILGSRMKTGNEQHHNLLTNGIVAHTNGENGIT